MLVLGSTRDVVVQSAQDVVIRFFKYAVKVDMFVDQNWPPSLWIFFFHFPLFFSDLPSSLGKSLKDWPPQTFTD